MAVTPAGVIAIDGPMKPSDAIRWRDFIRTKGPLRYQVVTEHHQDHICSAHYLEPEVIVSSEITFTEFKKSIATVEEGKERMLKYDPAAGPLLEGFRMRPPDITYKDRMTLRLGGRTFILLHGPGHSRGETMVHAVEDRVLFASDNISPGGAVAFHSADVWGWFQTLGMMEALDVDWYVPGHGEPCKKDEFPKQREKMLELIQMVRELKNQGLSREECQKKLNLVDDYFEKKGYERPRLLGPRAYMLMRGAVGNIYDYLDDHPSGGLAGRMDPIWENI
jgi:glyoxylase-like metal-dependent hydrolase (beta-lactamase superfamily II)